jgi:hypothetical protein
MIKISFFLITLSFSGSIYSQISKDEINLKTPLEEMEVTKGHSSPNTVSWRDRNTGLEEFHDLANDKFKFSIVPNINTNPYKLFNILTLDLAISKKYSEDLWLEGIFTFGKFVYNSISQINATNPVDHDEENETFTSFGIGIGRRTTYLRDFIYSENFYETIQAYFNLARFHENFLNQNFFGPGLRADYGMHYRFSESMHFGFKISYNIYAVRRSESFENEPASPRHLSLSWLSLGTDLSFYY